MKLYVHYEDHARAGTCTSSVWTKRIALTSALATIDDVLRVFCASYARKFSAVDSEAVALVPADVDVFTERNQESATRKRYEDDKRAQKWFVQWKANAGGKEARDCDFELIIVRKPVAARDEKRPNAVNVQQQAPQSPSVASPANASLGSSRERSAFHYYINPDHGKLKKGHQAPLEPLQAVLDLGANQMQQFKYRSAKQLFETLVLPIDPINAQVLVAMGDIHAANQRYDVAILDWYKKCWDAHSRKPFQDKKQAKLVFECGLKIVRCEIQRENYRQALSTIEKLQHLLRHEAKTKSKCLMALSTEKETMEARMDFLKAQALYKMYASSSPELQDPAIALLTHLLPDLQDPNVNLDALLLYSKIAFDRGKKSEALTMILRVLVSRPNDKMVKKQLAAFLKDSSSMKILQQVLPIEGGASSAAAYAFIGTILKDFGALESSVTCFERAMVGNPGSPSYALNHAHVLEVCNRYESALNVLTAFFKQNPFLSVGGTLLAGEILNALDNGDDCRLSTDQSSEVNDSQRSGQWRVEWVSRKDAGYARVYLNGNLAAAPKAKQGEGQKRSSVQLPDQDELDLLACFFTVVKILFLTGRVSKIPHLISLVEPVRVEKELHRTVIRNEQAYYSCIAQLLSVEEKFLPPSSRQQPSNSAGSSLIYVCGDSHTLATAWREIQVRGQSTILHPALVTGLKHWHLRKESVFYPKLNFWNVLAGIPRRSKVVFLFGEIDCREGILLAVEKCKYESIEEGMDATIRIFMDALGEAVRKFDFEAFVHPVVPVLNETRQLVIQYNKIFQEHVMKSKICEWLDFFDDLVHESPEKLRSDLVLDGTHLHPRYLSSLERALNTLNNLE